MLLIIINVLLSLVSNDNVNINGLAFLTLFIIFKIHILYDYIMYLPKL